jgi:predicted kinase
VGPVGAGKSTFGSRLAQGRRAVRLTLDEWMVTLFRPDRPDVGLVEWYTERSARCIEQIWAVATELLGTGTDVVLEIGLLRRHERAAFYQRVDAAKLELTIYVLDAARDIRRQRVMHRNHTAGPTFSMIVPVTVFEYASDLWEAPDPTECNGRNVSFIRTDE